MALPLGVESFDEVLDVELDETPGTDELRERLGACLPPGLEILACERASGTKAVRVIGSRFEAHLDQTSMSIARDGTERFHGPGVPLVVRERKGRTREIPLRDFVRDLSVEGDVLSFVLGYKDGASMKPDELLTWLGLDPVATKVTKRETLLDLDGQPTGPDPEDLATNDDRDEADDPSDAD